MGEDELKSLLRGRFTLLGVLKYLQQRQEIRRLAYAVQVDQIALLQARG